jgi:regulator of replication initiation timing
MEINYNLLNKRIFEMSNVKEMAADTNTVVLNKKHRGFVSQMEAILEENEALANENAKLQAEIKELRKELDAKGKSKDYIKKVESELDRLPPTRNVHKKTELVSLFVDFSLSVYDLMDKLPFSQSARYGYTERNFLVEEILNIFTQNLKDKYTSLGNGLRSEYPKGMPVKGLEVGSDITIKTLDDFILKFPHERLIKD